MKSSEKTIRHYIGIRKSWKIMIALLAAVMIVTAAMSITMKNQEEPEPVPFDPMTAERGDYCYFDAVGVSSWLYRVETENGSYKDYDIYYMAEDADGYLIIVNLDMGAETELFSQRLYFDGASLDDTVPAPHRFTGLAYPLREGDETRESIAEVLGIDDGNEFEYYFGNMVLTDGQSPKKMGAGRMEAAALFAGIFIFSLFMGSLKVITGTGASLKELKKYDKLDEAAQQFSVHDISEGADPAVVGDGYVFLKNKGIAICPEMVQEATCSGVTVSLKTKLDPKPTVLHFYTESDARRFMERIPLICVRDDEMMVKTEHPSEYMAASEAQNR